MTQLTWFNRSKESRVKPLKRRNIAERKLMTGPFDHIYPDESRGVPRPQGTVIQGENLQFLGKGTRTAVYEVEGSDPRRIIRLPLDPKNDDRHIANYFVLHSAFGDAHLANPKVVTINFEGKKRTVLACDFLPLSPATIRSEFTPWSFENHFDKLESLEEQMMLVRSLRSFIDGAKKLYEDHHLLPDMIGRGNVAAIGTAIILVDLNNLTSDWREGDHAHNDACFKELVIGDEVIHIPIDPLTSLPIFDLSLHALYVLEKELLSYTVKEHEGKSAITLKFTKLSNALNESIRDPNSQVNEGELTKFFQENFVDFNELKHDPFYGALRHPKRRKAVEEVTRRRDQERFGS